MPAIFELDAGRSVYYAHCSCCIALKLAPTTLQSKRLDIKIDTKLIPLREEQISLQVFCIYIKVHTVTRWTIV